MTAQRVLFLTGLGQRVKTGKYFTVLVINI